MYPRNPAHTSFISDLKLAVKLFNKMQDNIWESKVNLIYLFIHPFIREQS